MEEEKRDAKRAKTGAPVQDEACCEDSNANAPLTAAPQKDAYDSAEAWAAWEQEMRCYPGWENGSSAGVALTTGPTDASTMTQDTLISELLEDMETRASILRTMSEAGVPPATLREIYSSHVRTYVSDRGVEGGRCATGEAGGSTRRIYLAHDDERNLHVSVFGWGRFRRQDIAFIMQAGQNGPFIELGAGSGWLGKGDAK